MVGENELLLWAQKGPIKHTLLFLIPSEKHMAHLPLLKNKK